MSIAEIQHKGFMFVISSPSGVGKTTICRMLLQEDPSLVMSVSVTTRKKRAKETNGKDYYFVTSEQFQKMVSEEQFIEYANVFGEFYGTPQEHIEKNINNGVDVLFDIDWQGARQLKQAEPEKLVTIFLLPPSLKELENRINKRGQDSKQSINKRLAKAKDEIQHWEEYDYVLVNENVEETMRRIESILTAERLKRPRQKNLAKQVEAILNEGY